MGTGKPNRFGQRRAGVLLHPTSLPGDHEFGDLGNEAINFLYFMRDCGLSIWQILPLGPTHGDRSPYQCLSSHAGNPELIDLNELLKNQWLQPEELEAYRKAPKQTLIDISAERFFSVADEAQLEEFHEFCKSQDYWLKEFALYMVIRKQYQNADWTQWPDELKFRDSKALDDFRDRFQQKLDQAFFTQFIFFRQWKRLRDKANEMGIQIVGDLPFFVSQDSADVWSERENFLIDETGNSTAVAGVPPDAFSDDGQLWGNPLFDWEYQKQSGFTWWINRFKSQLNLYDWLRVDHFRGLDACWQIPAEEKSAKNGQWVDSPGAELLTALQDHFGHIPIIAEDLGLITDSVLKLRDDFKLPGMTVLQFAFDGDTGNFYLPHNHQRNSVVYTATHDNDTTLGWYESSPQHVKDFLKYYLDLEEKQLEMPGRMNRLALSSVASWCILPMQDLLLLDSSARMNIPGTTEDNWRWRFQWSQVWPELSREICELIRLYGRLPQ